MSQQAQQHIQPEVQQHETAAQTGAAATAQTGAADAAQQSRAAAAQSGAAAAAAAAAATDAWPSQPAAAAAAAATALPTRTVHCCDAIAWLQQQPVLGCSLITSQPDVSELQGSSLAQWKAWFTAVPGLVLCRCPDGSGGGHLLPDGHQGERRRLGGGKAYLVHAQQKTPAMPSGKVVCRAPPGDATFGKPAYHHMLCFSRGLRLGAADSTADVLPEAGDKTWTRGMGAAACAAACRFVLQHGQPDGGGPLLWSRDGVGGGQCPGAERGGRGAGRQARAAGQEADCNPDDIRGHRGAGRAGDELKLIRHDQQQPQQQQQQRQRQQQQQQQQQQCGAQQVPQRQPCLANECAIALH